VLLGVPRRTPAHPAVGEYYSSIVVPLDANIGEYRIRWSFREFVNGPIQQVVQEFEVVDRTIECVTAMSCVEEDFIRRLRILLRDNCVGGEETVELDVDGEKMVTTIRDLWETIHGTP